LTGLFVCEETSLDSNVAENKVIERKRDLLGGLTDDYQSAMLSQEVRTELKSGIRSSGNNHSVEAFERVVLLQLANVGERGFRSFGRIDEKIRSVFQRLGQFQWFFTGVDADDRQILKSKASSGINQAFCKLDAEMAQSAEPDDAENVAFLEIRPLDGRVNCCSGTEKRSSMLKGQ
jgi:hypothetical protein